MGDSLPNIIWLTVDSIRADHTSVNNYSRDTTPNLERIAESSSSVSFNNCISEGIWSLPVGTSILTGTYPNYHNTVCEGDMVPDDLKTLPELFGEVGYETYGVSGNPWFSDATGMNRGFDHFEYISKSNLTAAGIMPFARFILGLKRHSAGYTLDTSAHFTDFIALEAVKEWVDTTSSSENPSFIYAHTEGAHTPYCPPMKNLKLFSDDVDMSPSEILDFSKYVGKNIHKLISEEVDFTKEEQDALGVAYDALIHYLDSRIGSVYDKIKKSDIKPTILVITSDHGDLLGENGLLSHKISLHSGITRVPMVIHGVDLDKKDSLVQHVDVVKEVARRAGVSHPQFQGKLIGDRDYSLTHRSEGYFNTTTEIISQYNADFDTSQFHTKDTNSLVKSGYKLVKSSDKEKLYDLPNEESECEDNDVRIQLRDELARAVSELSRDSQTDQRAEFGDQVKQQLSDLGYM
ncbi:sulfatase [Haloferax volcanii]|uniref:Sulfatase n=1 Tax=Haloferax volcanii TaxID=2246 RepID=A0A558G9J0_HALVO|nr:sulfatase [Haloferax volcanii]TVT94430.1 sulfatase [Haloferax volcanii]